MCWIYCKWLNILIALMYVLCMHVYIHVHMYMYDHVIMYMYVYVDVHVCIYVHVRICIRIYVYVYMYICICIYVYMYICIYVYMHICREVENLTKTEFKNLLDLACKNALFVFDGIHYHQIDGVAVGSPLGPCLTNIFMSYHEKIWLHECPDDIKPKFYCRYVDDIFILCESREKLARFKDYFNSKHA